MRDFMEKETRRIQALEDTEESFRAWYAHYLTLDAKEQAVADYLLTAAGKDSYADDYMGLQLCPVSCADQSNVNNGYGVLYALRRECFPWKDVKLCFLRSDMWVGTEKQVPQWILTLEREIGLYSSGLGQVQTEVIPYSFAEEETCDYYAVTFRLSSAAVRKTISMFGEEWDTREIGEYILALTDISGEFAYVLGVLEGGKVVPLWENSMYFK